jgi:hypothetical protein
MATYNAVNLMSKPRHMGEFGNGVVTWGSLTPGGGALNDVYKLVVIPAGWEVTDVDIVYPDLDTGSAMAVSVGYAPVNAADGPTAAPAYFQAANTFVSGTAGRRSLAFKPIKFEQPVFLTMTVTTAATTFAAGEVIGIVKGDGVGRV